MLREAFNDHFPYAPKTRFYDLLVAIIDIYEVTLGDLEYQLKRIKVEELDSEKAFDQYLDDIANGRAPKVIQHEVEFGRIPSLVADLQQCLNEARASAMLNLEHLYKKG